MLTASLCVLCKCICSTNATLLLSPLLFIPSLIALSELITVYSCAVCLLSSPTRCVFLYSYMPVSRESSPVLTVTTESCLDILMDLLRITSFEHVGIVEYFAHYNR